MTDKTELQPAPYEVTCIAPHGVGYGEGTISADRATHAEYPVTSEQLQEAVAVLERHHDSYILPVEADDDGCGDGRPATRIIDNGEVAPDALSQRRAKIFGGGLQVAASMWRATQGAPVNGETVLGDRVFIGGQLERLGIHYGAHTDEHAHGDNCGCGAIDKYTRSVEVTAEYRDAIAANVGLFIADAGSDRGVDRAFATRDALIGSDYMQDAAGSKTMEYILHDGAIVKELGGGHLEAIALFNAEPGTTVDQAEVAALFREAGLPEGIQVFAVDTWRGDMYAHVVADIAAERGALRDDAFAAARADFYINQLAVAATLTQGDLPILVNAPTA